MFYKLALGFLTIFIVSCGSLLQDGKVVVNSAQIKQSVSSLQQNYVAVRFTVQENKNIFDANEWAELKAGDDMLKRAYNELQRLSNSGQADLILTTGDILRIVNPIRQAVSRMMAIMDKKILLMGGNNYLAYIKLGRDVTLSNGYINRLLEEKDNRVKAKMITDLIRVSGQIAGIAAIALTG